MRRCRAPTKRLLACLMYSSIWSTGSFGLDLKPSFSHRWGGPWVSSSSNATKPKPAIKIQSFSTKSKILLLNFNNRVGLTWLVLLRPSCQHAMVNQPQQLWCIQATPPKFILNCQVHISGSSKTDIGQPSPARATPYSVAKDRPPSGVESLSTVDISRGCPAGHSMSNTLITNSQPAIIGKAIFKSQAWQGQLR